MVYDYDEENEVEIDQKPKKKKKPELFYQFYKEAFGSVLFLAKNNPTANKVFLFIIKYMDIMNSLIVSQHAMCEELGIGRTNAWKAIKYLEKHNYIEKHKTGSSNVYVVNCKIVWSQSRSGRRYAHFKAAVFIAESEQPGYSRKVGMYEKKHKKTQIKPNRNFDFEQY